MLRYPARSAVPTAPTTSSPPTCHTPNPSCGIRTPLPRETSGIYDLLFSPLAGVPPPPSAPPPRDSSGGCAAPAPPSPVRRAPRRPPLAVDLGLAAPPCFEIPAGRNRSRPLDTRM